MTIIYPFLNWYCNILVPSHQNWSFKCWIQTSTLMAMQRRAIHVPWPQDSNLDDSSNENLLGLHFHIVFPHTWSYLDPDQAILAVPLNFCRRLLLLAHVGTCSPGERTCKAASAFWEAPNRLRRPYWRVLKLQNWRVFWMFEVCFSLTYQRFFILFRHLDCTWKEWLKSMQLKLCVSVMEHHMFPSGAWRLGVSVACPHLASHDTLVDCSIVVLLRGPQTKLLLCICFCTRNMNCPSW